MKVFLNHPEAKLPTKAHPTDAGWDLYSVENVTVYPGDPVLIDTGIHLSFQAGYVGLIRPRSGLAVKNKIDVMAGVIDASFRGSIKVLLNQEGLHHLDNVKINVGDRIAQFLLMPMADKLYDLMTDVNASLRQISEIRIVDGQLVNLPELLNESDYEFGRLVEVASLEDLDFGVRGEAGFGSSGR